MNKVSNKGKARPRSQTLKNLIYHKSCFFFTDSKSEDACKHNYLMQSDSCCNIKLFCNIKKKIIKKVKMTFFSL